MDAQAKAIVKRHVGDQKWAQGKARAKELVRECRDIDLRQTKVHWAWGELSLEIIPTTTDKGGLQSVLLKLFMEDFEYPFTFGTLKQVRWTCTKWPKAKRSKTASFGVHAILNTHPDRFTLIRDDLKASEAREMVGYKPIRIQRTSNAIQCANAAKSWTHSLIKRLETSKPSEDLVVAVSDAWYELTQAVEQLGLLDELIREYGEEHEFELVA